MYERGIPRVHYIADNHYQHTKQAAQQMFNFLYHLIKYLMLISYGCTIMVQIKKYFKSSYQDPIHKLLVAQITKHKQTYQVSTIYFVYT